MYRRCVGKSSNRCSCSYRLVASMFGRCLIGPICRRARAADQREALGRQPDERRLLVRPLREVPRWWLTRSAGRVRRGCLSMHCAGPALAIRTHGDSRSEASGRKRRMNHHLKNSQGLDREPSFRGRIAASSTPQFETVECGSTVQGQPRSHVAISRHPEERAGSGGDDDPRSQSVPAREDVIRAEARGPAARDQPARRCVHHH